MLKKLKVFISNSVYVRKAAFVFISHTNINDFIYKKMKSVFLVCIEQNKQPVFHILMTTN